MKNDKKKKKKVSFMKNLDKWWGKHPTVIAKSIPSY